MGPTAAAQAVIAQPPAVVGTFGGMFRSLRALVVVEHARRERRLVARANQQLAAREPRDRLTAEIL